MSRITFLIISILFIVSCRSQKTVQSSMSEQTDNVRVESRYDSAYYDNIHTNNRTENKEISTDEFTYRVEYSAPDVNGVQHITSETYTGKCANVNIGMNQTSSSAQRGGRKRVSEQTELKKTKRSANHNASTKQTSGSVFAWGGWELLSLIIAVLLCVIGWYMAKRKGFF